MTRRLVFITHPNVAIDPVLPVPSWPLSPLGQARMRAGLAQPWVHEVTAVHCSRERKAIDGAMILAGHLGLRCTQHDDLGENDRSSTGFLPPPEFERTADAFFAEPQASVRGWERAIDAQRRIVGAVERIARDAAGAGVVAIVSHGAVGALLQCHLAGEPISRQRDQPGSGGGHWFAFTLDPRALLSGWQPIDAV